MADAMIYLVMAAVFLVYWQLSNQRQWLEAKFDAQQRRLDAIAQHFSVDVTEKVPPEVAGLLQAGRKIEAIKVYRQATGAGLAEAKEAVERMQAERGGTIIQP